MKLLQIGCLLAILAATSSTQAQWQWLDKDGRKVFSDRPPPADVSDKNIVKRPAAAIKPAAAPDDIAHDDANANAPPAVAKNTGEDKQLQLRKKQLADADAAKQKAEQDRAAQSRADNCSRARQSKATYSSGGRVAKTNAKGEREIMDDAAVASELRHIQEIIDSDCK
jgi:hypothetical protein